MQVQQLLAGVNAAIAKLPKVQGGAQPAMSNALQKTLDRASKEAEGLGDDADLHRAPAAGAELRPREIPEGMTRWLRR